MATKIGEFREQLIEVISAVRAREIKPDEAKAIAMLAAQVTLSLQVEIASRTQAYEADGRPVPFGDLTLGQEHEVPKLKAPVR